MKLFNPLAILLAIAGCFFFNIYIIQNRWLHLIILLVFCALPLGRSRFFPKDSRYSRVLLILLWALALLVFGLYTLMAIMFSYPP